MTIDGYSPYTIAYRVRVLAQIVAWLEAQGLSEPRDVDTSTLADYQFSLTLHRKADGSPLAVDTQACYVGTLKGFFRWLFDSQHLQVNPAADLRLPRVRRRLPRTVLSHREVERVLAMPAIDSPVGLRDRTIMEVLYSTGIRRSELCRLRIDDINASRGIIVVELGKDAAIALCRLVAARSAGCATTSIVRALC